MAFSQMVDLGYSIKTVPGVAPASNQAGTVNGSAIDRINFDSIVLFGQTGPVSGSPTSFSIIYKVQHCDASGGTYTDYIPPNASTVAQIVLDAASQSKELTVNIRGAKQFIRIVQVAAFTGGSTPAALASSAVTLGGAYKLPA